MSNSANASLRYPHFRLFLLARMGLAVAVQIQIIIVSWQLYTITHDPLSLGILGLTEAIPSILVSLYAGHLADVRNRRPIIQTCVFVLIGCSSCLLFFSLPEGQWVFGEGSALPIYGVIFVSGIARGFLSPAMFSFMPQLVERHVYQNAVTWNSAVYLNSSVAGPMIGGWIYAQFGPKGGYMIDLMFLCASFVIILFLPNKPVPPATDEWGIFEKIKSGLRFVFSNPTILGALSLDLFAVLFGGAVALLPVFAEDILFVGPEGLGMMRAAPAVGSFLMAMAMTRYPVRKHMGKILFFCIAGFGFSIIGFGLSTVFWLSVLCLFLSGGFDSVSMVIRSTLIHTITPENMKGRVSAINSIFIGSSNEIGAFESGITARYMGTVASVVFGGMMTLAVVISMSIINPTLRKLNNIK